MSHTLKVSPHTTLAFCSDCGTDHISPVPCGMSYRERLCSVRLDGTATATRTKQRYWDSSSLDDFWGKDESERREEMLEETKGIGPVTRDEMGTPKSRALAKTIGIAAE